LGQVRANFLRARECIPQQGGTMVGTSPSPLRVSAPAPRFPTSSFSGPRLARMHAALERQVECGNLSGLVALVDHEEREHLETIGTMGFGNPAPIRRDTLFRLASTTKPITAIGAMILVEECRIRLDDPVQQWLPELADRRVLRTIEGPLDDTVPAARPITLRDLLTFRSGYGEIMFLAPTSPYQRAMVEARLPLAEFPFAGNSDEFMRRLGELPLAAQPGERWLYHMSAEILGVLIARISGKPLGTFLAERLFEPLGMTDTTFHVDEARRDRLPACYGTDFASGKLVVLEEAGGGYAARPETFESGAGGLVSTVDDLLALGRMMLGAASWREERILSRPTIELMTTDHITRDQKARSPFFPGFWETWGWGLGMGVITARRDIGDVPGRFGWDGAFGTSWHVDPRNGLVGIFLTQRRPDRLTLPDFLLDFWTSAYQLIED
jgi:CubicO group peptidase (beta-lactamase class C family)